MGKAITLGVVLGAKLAPGFGAVFRTAKEQAQGLKTTLANARLGSTAAADVARLGARLDRLKTSQATLGTDNAKLASRVAQTQRELGKASATASRYGVSLDNAASKHRKFAASADQATASLSRLRAAEQRKAVRDEAKGQILGTVGMAVSVAAPVKASMDFEHHLRAIGNIADLSGKQVLELGQSVQHTGVDVNQTSDAMLDAYNVLLGKGLDPGRATAVLAPIGKTATASQASVEDLSTTTFSLLDNLKLSENEIPKAMDMLAQAGKEGSFELKDMARYFPQLTAQAATLGLKGTEAVATLGASLQVAMQGAGAPEEAATNLRNFLQKATAPDTVKNFAKLGINLEASLKKAMAKGKNPLEYLLDLIQKVTKGDKFKVGALFGDMQVQNFLAPMMQHMEEYREIKTKSLGASGVVDRDFANMMATGTERVKHAGIELKRLGVTLGTTLLPVVGLVADKLGVFLSTVNTLAQAHPKLTAAIIATTVGLVGFKVAVLAAKFGGTLLFDGLGLLTGAFNLFSPVILRTNKALLASKAASLGAAVGARTLNVALLANPIGLVAVGIAAGAFLIWKYWGPIKSFFKGLWDGLSEGLQPFTSKLEGLGLAIDPVLTKVKALWDIVSKFFSTQDQGASEEAESWGKRIGKALPKILGFALPAPVTAGVQWWLQKDDAQHQNSDATPAQSIGPAVTPAAPVPAHGVQPVTPPAQPFGHTATPVAPVSAHGVQSIPPSAQSIGQAVTPVAPVSAYGAQPAAPPSEPISQPVAPSAVGKQVVQPAGGVTIENNVSITGVGLETVQQIVKAALDAFTRDLDSKLEAMRAQQLRLSYGG